MDNANQKRGKCGITNVLVQDLTLYKATAQQLDTQDWATVDGDGVRCAVLFWRNKREGANDASYMPQLERRVAA